MKILLLGDSHFDNHRPDRRLDADYFATMLGKLIQVVEIYKERKCDVLLQVGDFFNSFRANDEIKSALIAYLREEELRICCVYGQHDISGHSETTFKNSPLRVLEASGVVKILGADYHTLGPTFFRNIYFYGASFGQKIPKPDDVDAYNVLVVHQMIGDEPLFPGQDIQHPRAFLRKKLDYNLIVCGDYHYRFVEESQGRFCINPGAMIRKTIADKDLELKPAVVVFDTEERAYEIIELNIEPAELIFDISRKKKKGEEDYAALLTFLENLKKSQGTTVGWKEILIHLLDKEKADDDVRTMIDKCILQVEG